jgi:hypothetical protein
MGTLLENLTKEIYDIKTILLDIKREIDEIKEKIDEEELTEEELKLIEEAEEDLIKGKTMSLEELKSRLEKNV